MMAIGTLPGRGCVGLDWAFKATNNVTPGQSTSPSDEALGTLSILQAGTKGTQRRRYRPGHVVR